MLKLLFYCDFSEEKNELHVSGKLNNLQKADFEENIVSCNVLEASSPIAKGICTAI